jgi:hypothetical protein
MPVKIYKRYDKDKDWVFDDVYYTSYITDHKVGFRNDRGGVFTFDINEIKNPDRLKFEIL